MRRLLTAVMLYMMVLLAVMPARAAEADMEKANVAWDLKSGKTVTCQTRFTGLDKDIPVKFRLSGMTDGITENGMRKISFTLVYTCDFAPTEAETRIIGNAGVDGTIGNLVCWTLCDYETGYNLEVENEHRVEETYDHLDSSFERYDAADGTQISILRKKRYFITVTFPKDYDGLCIGVLGLKTALPSEIDNQFWNGRLPFSRSGYCSAIDQHFSHFMRIRAAGAPEPEPERIDISRAKIGKIKDQAYTGKAVKPSLTIRYSGRKLVKDTDFTVAYYNNKKIGEAKIVIEGIGRYTGSIVKTFRIVPKKMKLSAVTAGKKQLTVRWKKSASVDGYQIEYGLKKDFSDAKKLNIEGAGQQKTVIKNLKSKKTYYVRIRSYQYAMAEQYFSAWSDFMKEKVK